MPSSDSILACALYRMPADPDASRSNTVLPDAVAGQSADFDFPQSPDRHALTEPLSVGASCAT